MQEEASADVLVVALPLVLVGIAGVIAIVSSFRSWLRRRRAAAEADRQAVIRAAQRADEERS